MAATQTAGAWTEHRSSKFPDFLNPKLHYQTTLESVNPGLTEYRLFKIDL